MFCWQETKLTLIADSRPVRAHPLSVFEALVKGAHQASGGNGRLLWHWDNQSVEAMAYGPGDRIRLTLQLFDANEQTARLLADQLHQRFAPEHVTQTHFTLQALESWQSVRIDTQRVSEEPARWALDFLTPLHLPGALRCQEGANPLLFAQACQKRLDKLFSRSAQSVWLPPLPRIETDVDWRYVKIVHRSRSQRGNPLFINGCIGRLWLHDLAGDWAPWLALLARVGVGERLSFAQGRFTLTRQPLASDQATHPVGRTVVIERSGVRLKLEQDGLVIHCQQRQQRLPLVMIKAVLCAAPVGLSSNLISRLNDRGIPLALSLPGESPVILAGGTAGWKRAQLRYRHWRAYESLSAAQKTQLAAIVVIAKLAGQIRLIRSRYQKGDYRLLQLLEAISHRLRSCDTLDQVRGLEGRAARVYFPWLAARLSLVPWQGRRKRTPAPDLLNALLNYLYTLLRNHMHIRLQISGLEPYLGVLHQANGRHPALVSDLMEPVRPECERMLLRLFGLRVIDAQTLIESYRETGKLPADVRRRLIEAYWQDRRIENGVESAVENYVRAVELGRLLLWRP